MENYPSQNPVLLASTSLKQANPWAMFGIVAVAVFLVSLDATIVLAAFPALRASFPGVEPALLSWTLNAYTIVYAALLVPAGKFADSHGRRRTFLLGLALFGLASALSGLAPDPYWLIAYRALQAIGAAALTPASLALILAAFPVEKRALAVGLWGAVGALAAAFGPAVGGWLVQLAGWQAVFLVNVPIVALALWRSAAQLAESKGNSSGDVDVLGIALLIASIGSIVLGLVQSENWGINRSLAISLGGVILLILFILWARGRENAALDLTLFHDPTYTWTNAATFVFGATFSMMFLMFFLFLTGPWGFGLGMAGLLVTPGPLAVVPIAILAGRLAGRIGHRPFIFVGGLIYAAGNLWFLLRLSTTPSLMDWMIGLILGGMGVGLVLPALSGAAVSKLKPQQFAMGNAANAAIRQVGGALGAATAVLLAGRSGADFADFQTLFTLLIGGGIVTALLSLPINSRASG